MKHMRTLAIVCLAALCCSLASCGGKSDPQAETPPPLKVQSVAAENVFATDCPEQFALVTAQQHMAARQLRVTGTEAPDVARSVPVVSLAAGRVVAISAPGKGEEMRRCRSAFPDCTGI